MISLWRKLLSHTDNYMYDATSYASLSWKRMLPNVCDTLIIIYLGAVALQVATAVFITVLTINIALMSYISVVMMHNVSSAKKCVLYSNIILASLFVSMINIPLSVLAWYSFTDEVKIETVLFLILGSARPLISGVVSYCRETLFHEKRQEEVHKITTNTTIIYVVVNISSVLVFSYIHESPSVLIFLIGTYAASLYALYRYLNITSSEYMQRWGDLKRIFSNASLAFKLKGMRSALSAAATNCMEMGFLAAIGFVLTAKFPPIALAFYPLFTIMEWVSGLAVGLSRVNTERLIKKENIISVFQMIYGYITYSIIVYMLIIFFFRYISFEIKTTSVFIIFYALIYISFDGMQLMFRGLLVSDPNDKLLLRVGVCTFSFASFLLLFAFYSESKVLLGVSVIAPPFLLATIVPFLFGRKMESRRHYECK